MNPEQVLDHQADLAYRATTELFQRYVSMTVGSAMSSRIAGGTLPGRDWHPSKQDWMASKLAQVMPVQATMADAYRVTSDMSMVIQRAAEALEPEDLVDRNLAPTSFGLVRFERPLPIIDARGRVMLIHWALWGPTTDIDGTPGVIVSWFNDHIVEPDDYAKDLLAESNYEGFFDIVGNWGFIGCDFLRQGSSLGEQWIQLTPEDEAALYADGATPTAHTNTNRYLHALWLLLGQTVAQVQEEYVRKTVLRAAKRKGLPGRVTVIALRRSEDSARRQDESTVEWAHRWLVRGHWRWQPYGQRSAPHEHVYGPAEWDGHSGSTRRCQVSDCDSEIRRIWINMQVRGPEDKPLVVSKKVYDLRR